MSEALSEVSVATNERPVISNVTAEVLEPGTSPEKIRELLVRQVVAPVRWESSLRRALEIPGVERAMLMGPGKMLRSHLKRVRRRMPMVSFDGLAEVRKHLGVPNSEKESER